MWHFFMSAYVFILFVLLTPGIVLTLPKNGSRLTVAIVHALVFTVIFHYGHKAVWDYFYAANK